MSKPRAKVLHVISGLRTGGAENALFNLLANGLLEDFHCQVISLERKDSMFGKKIMDLGVEIDALNLQKKINLLRAKTNLSRIAAKFNPDIVQGWMYHGDLAADTIARSHSPTLLPVVWNIRHSLNETNREKFLTRQIINAHKRRSKNVDAIIYNSRTSREQHCNLGLSDKKSIVIPNGFLDHGTRQALTREDMGIPDNSFVIGHVARLHPMKNQTGFLKLAVELAQANSGFFTIMCGKDVCVHNKDLLALIPEDLRSRFLLLGERNDVQQLYPLMDTLCSSSLWGEAFPNVLGEAMHAGVPCIATDIGDCKYIIDDTGIVVPANSPQSLKLAIEEVLNKTAQQRQRLGQLARSRIRDHFSIAKNVSSYVELYDQLLKANSRN